MNFLEIVNECLADHFKESQRPRIQRWVNTTYGWLWATEQWTFRYATDDVTVTASSDTLTSVPTDLGPVVALFDDDGWELEYVSPVEWHNRYYGSDSEGTPEAYTIINGTITVGPTPSTTFTDYRLFYEKLRTDMTADGDEPLIPSEFHYVLVHGATETGLVRQKNPLAAMERALRDEGAAAMRRAYLADQKAQNQQWGAYRPGLGAWAR